MRTKLENVCWAGLVLFVVLTPACRSFRNTIMDMRNTDMVGRVAPPIEGDAWILPEGATVPPGEPGKWRVAAFLKPK